MRKITKHGAKDNLMHGLVLTMVHIDRTPLKRLRSTYFSPELCCRVKCGVAKY